MRPFMVWRPEPPEAYQAQGLTNAGRAPDYEGVIFTDGTVVVRWLTVHRSHSVWSSWADFWAVHGHPEYGTQIVWADGKPPPDGA